MQIEREQEQKIEQFFEAYYRIKKWDKQSSEVVAGVFVCIQIVLMAFPIQLLYTEENRLGLLLLIGTFGMYAPLYYMLPYRILKEGKQKTMVWKKLKYLPVGLESFKKWRIRLLVRYVEKVFFACLIIQLLFSLITIHRISWANIVYVVLAGFAIPMLVNALGIILEK